MDAGIRRHWRDLLYWPWWWRNSVSQRGEDRIGGAPRAATFLVGFLVAARLTDTPEAASFTTERVFTISTGTERRRTSRRRSLNPARRRPCRCKGTDTPSSSGGQARPGRCAGLSETASSPTPYRHRRTDRDSGSLHDGDDSGRYRNGHDGGDTAPAHRDRDHDGPRHGDRPGDRDYHPDRHGHGDGDAPP